MNYRHAFHAGNHADVLKHAVLLACLAHLKQKPAPFAVLDTHAGVGSYDLTSAEAQRSPEWQDGAARVFDWDAPPPLIAPYRDTLRQANADGALTSYPGSPVLIRNALRTNDRLIACELHPEDAATLKARFRGDARAQIHARDGWQALRALLPLPERRGLVLIDPPYEEPGELARAGREFAVALARFSGIFIWWRPMKSADSLDAIDADLRLAARGLANPPELLRIDLAVAAPHQESRLTASSLLLANPPFGLKNALFTDLPLLTTRLARGVGGAWRVA